MVPDQGETLLARRSKTCSVLVESLACSLTRFRRSVALSKPNQSKQNHAKHNLACIPDCTFSDLFDAEMPKKKGVKIRHASGSKLGEYLGAGRDLLISELPTIRDVLRLGIK